MLILAPDYFQPNVSNSLNNANYNFVIISKPKEKMSDLKFIGDVILVHVYLWTYGCSYLTAQKVVFLLSLKDFWVCLCILLLIMFLQYNL